VPPDSDEFARRMRQVGEVLRASGVGAIYLVHGTFAGADAWGLLNHLERYWPALGDSWRRLAKQLVDAVMGDVGNYTPQYAQRLAAAINPPGAEPITVRRCVWSGENHHIGRADGAVRMIDELASATVPPGRRVLLWGHSHAGNVLALMSQLLSSDRAALDDFFNATKVFYRRSLFHRGELDPWRRVADLLAGGARPMAQTPLDFVTFGTPIRYGWSTAGGKLLHFVNHRPADGLPPFRAPFPPRERDVRAATHGDYVQQLGIAGTNFMPNLLSWRAVLADRRLGELLQPGIRRRDLLERLRLGMRVPETGTTLLVDYGPGEGGIARHLAGHGVYTREEWMLFHAEEVARRLYGAGAGGTVPAA
jgi:hypothetical protein